MAIEVERTDFFFYIPLKGSEHTTAAPFMRENFVSYPNVLDGPLAAIGHRDHRAWNKTVVFGSDERLEARKEQFSFPGVAVVDGHSVGHVRMIDFGFEVVDRSFVSPLGHGPDREHGSLCIDTKTESVFAAISNRTLEQRFEVGAP